MVSIYDAERKARPAAGLCRLVPPVTALFAGFGLGGRLGPAGDPRSAADRFCLVPPVTALSAGFGFGGRLGPVGDPRHGDPRHGGRPGMAVAAPGAAPAWRS